MNAEQEAAHSGATPDCGDNHDQRRPYNPPRLLAHGTLEKITGNVGNGFLDFPQGSSIAG